jgi:protein gp37
MVGHAEFVNPKRPTVFPSLCDWLDPEVPAGMLARFLALVQRTPDLTWLLLTKRPELWHERLIAARLHAAHLGLLPGNSHWGDLVAWINRWVSGDAPSNVWLGTSVEDQQRADQRIPHLLDTPAAGRFLSVEPLLGPVDFDGRRLEWLAPFHDTDPMLARTPRINWVIIGGESGPNARPCNVEWIRRIVEDCEGASTPCFVKQLGAVVIEPQCMCPGTLDGGPDCRLCGCRRFLAHSKGGDPAEWPEDLRVREFPEGLR